MIYQDIKKYAAYLVKVLVGNQKNQDDDEKHMKIKYGIFRRIEENFLQNIVQLKIKQMKE